MDALGRHEALVAEWCATGRYLDHRLRNEGGLILIRREPAGLVVTHRRTPLDDPAAEETIAYCRDDHVPWGTGGD